MSASLSSNTVLAARTPASAGTLKGVFLAGTGSYLPERVLTNADLQSLVDTTEEWIFSRTGMKERRIARKDETSSAMGTEAARRAMDDAGIRPDEIGMIAVATSTPDMVFPSTACLIQERLGARHAFCMDLSAACSGFLYALETARRFLCSGGAASALVIGAEKMSCITDWKDRTTCVLFGDAAGAAVLRAGGRGRGILSTVLGADGSLGDLLKVPGGGSLHPASEETVSKRLHFIKMQGREVFKHAVTSMAEAARSALAQAGLGVGDVDWIIPHQANARIIQAIGQRMGVPAEKFCVNVDRYGNTSAASVILALDEAARDRRIGDGQIVLLVAFGGGFTWGATVLEWGKA